MSEKFQDRYRIQSARMKGWDYRSNGAYFITICTQHRFPFFGKIVDHRFVESKIGAVARQCWTDIPQHCLNIELGSFIIMPNHVHGILIIGHPGDHPMGKPANASVETLHATSPPPAKHQTPVETLHATSPMPTNHQPPVETLHATSLQPRSPLTMSVIAPKMGSVATAIRSFKSAVSKHARSINPFFEWQSRYHDHIIRDYNSYEVISRYIETNPEHWQEDRMNK